MMVRVVLLFLFGTLGVGAIVWRSDVEAVETKAAGEMKQVGQLLYSPLRICGGSCVAIGGKWVLTSRHGTAKWSSGQLRVTFPALGHTIYQVEKVILPKDGDLALLRVEKSVRGAREMALYEGDDEVGKRVWIGGFGISGPAGKLGVGGRFHSGHNRIDTLRKGKLAITLSKPDDATVEKDEATIALLDSGSPMFVETGQDWQLAGIGSTASNGSNPSYGDRGSYARISTARKWIKETVGR